MIPEPGNRKPFANPCNPDGSGHFVTETVDEYVFQGLASCWVREVVSIEE